MFDYLYTIFQRTLAFVMLIFLSPVIVLIVFIKYIKDGKEIIFVQKRMGRNEKPFLLYKFKTMVKDAEKIQKTKKFQRLNEADGPVFKIRNDPRYTKFGKFLAHSGMDEIPQLVNIIKGEMAFVGPRPLPLYEAKKIPLKYKKRFLVLPGATSSWIINGSHRIKFKKWMELDLEYVEKKSILLDAKIIFLTIYLMTKNLITILKK